MSGCAVCGGSESLALEAREAVPIAQNLVFPTREAALSCPTGALEMRRCTHCGFVWNARFDPVLLVYDAAYDNDQNFSPRFRGHTEQIADTIAQRLKAVPQVDLIEVGCGQGKFLAVLAARLGGQLRSAVGYDPAWRGQENGLPPRSEVRAEHFVGQRSMRAGDPSPGVVLSRHVIEHVPDPLAFLRGVREAMADGTPLFLETPDVDWILSRGAFFDFYYEHCSLFTSRALSLALERAGFVVEDLRPVFDGQYLLAAAVAGEPRAVAPTLGRFGDLGYNSKRRDFLETLAALIDRRRARGLAGLWGGASKGVTICLTLPDATRRIDCVVDINERKQGTFMPSLGIGIVAPAEAYRRGVRSLVVVNPAYFDEVAAYCTEAGLGFELISIDGDGPTGAAASTSA